MSEKPRYLDENLSDDEQRGGQTRLPSPEREGEGRGKSAEQPYPGEEKRNDRSFERPDEFGDGDRRS